MDISQTIYWHLKRLQLDWKDLERDLGICPSTVWRWQRGETRPRRTTIKSVENYLGLPDGCLEGRALLPECVALLGDQIVLMGAAKKAFEALLSCRTRDRQHAFLEELRSHYRQVAPVESPATLAAGDGTS
ncbi:MAG: helix-turn-helix transcriptional regulator [Planctomycetota bacterium]